MNRGIILLTALTLTACSDAEPTRTAATVTTTTTTVSAADTAYLTRVRDSVTGGSDAGLIAAGHRVCDLQSRGYDDMQAADVLVDEGFATSAAAAITVAAAEVYCKG